MAGKPLWRRAFDAVERPTAGRLERAVQTEVFADALARFVGLRSAVGRRAERASRRALHRLNLPAASDVVGVGTDWVAVSDMSDEQTVGLLRQLQRKLIGTEGKVRSGALTARGRPSA